MQNKLFKKSSVERFSSPEKLNDYIQVSSISSWMVLTAALALMLGMLIWGFFGELTESKTFSGVVKDGALQCYVSSDVNAVLDPGMNVSISPMSAEDGAAVIQGSVTAISDYPLSYDEASEGIESDYLKAALGISAWSFPVEIQPEESLMDGMVYSISVVTNTMRPAELVFR